MEQIANVLRSLNEALGQLKQATEVMQQDIKAARQAEADANARVEAIKIRESGVLKKEHLIMDAEKFIQAQNLLEQGKSDLYNEKRSWEKKLGEQKTALEQLEADLTSGIQDLKRRQAEFEKERAEYKAKFLDVMSK